MRGVIDLADKNIQAVILGSKNNKKSLDIFNKFIELMEEIGIKPSVFRNGKNSTHLAYKTSSDEVYISNLNIDRILRRGATEEEALKGGFEHVQIAPYDEIG